MYTIIFDKEHIGIIEEKDFPLNVKVIHNKGKVTIECPIEKCFSRVQTILIHNRIDFIVPGEKNDE